MLPLTNATLPYAVKIANKGWKEAALSDHGIKTGLNIVNGKVTYKGVADAFTLDFSSERSIAVSKKQRNCPIVSSNSVIINH
jgi:alanine dehydrogenase